VISPVLDEGIYWVEIADPDGTTRQEKLLYLNGEFTDGAFVYSPQILRIVSCVVSEKSCAVCGRWLGYCDHSPSGES
jgi:hypothetical protein